MVDDLTTEVNREKLEAPLLKQLEDLSKSEELRLVHAAGYANQALLGMPNNEGQS